LPLRVKSYHPERKTYSVGSSDLDDRGQNEAGLRQGTLHQSDGVDFSHVARDRDLRNKHVARAIQHLLFAEGKRLIDMQLQKNLKDLGGLQQVSALHFVGILLEAHLPIGVERTPAGGQVRKNSGVSPVFRTPPQPDIRRIGKRHQHRHTAATKTEKVEFFECGAEGAGADVLDGANTLVGIYHLVADLKVHHCTGSPTNHRCQV